MLGGEAMKKQNPDPKPGLNWDTIFDSLKDPIMIVDLENRIINCNQAMAALVGEPAGRLINRRCCIVMHDQLRPPFDCPVQRVCRTQAREAVTKKVADKWFNIVVDPVFDTAGELMGAVHVMYDVTAQEKLRSEDPLTGSFTRNYLETKLAMLMPKRTGGLIIADIDGLKIINDAHGCKEGDALLIEVAAMLRKALSPKAIIARTGEDAFGMLLPDCVEADVAEACRDIRAAVDAFNAAKGQQFLSLSLGSAFSAGSVDSPSLFSLAQHDVCRQKVLNSRSVHNATAVTIKKLMEAKDACTEQHSGRSQELGARLAATMGLPDSSVNGLRLLGRFHDIGKIGVPDNILLKPDRLTEDEFQAMSKHSEIGYYIALSLPDIAHIADWILTHHERWDGSGYPRRLQAKQIPVECRIMALVDAYDAMTNDRPYRKAMSDKEAIAEIERCRGSQFDPELADKFIDMVITGLC